VNANERLVSKGNIYCSDPSHDKWNGEALIPADHIFWLSADGERILCGPCYDRIMEDGPVLDGEDLDYDYEAPND
jgi:hypothetical protein